MQKMHSKMQLTFTYMEEDDRGKGEALSQMTYHLKKYKNC